MARPIEYHLVGRPRRAYVQAEYRTRTKDDPLTAVIQATEGTAHAVRYVHPAEHPIRRYQRIQRYFRRRHLRYHQVPSVTTAQPGMTITAWVE